MSKIYRGKSKKSKITSENEPIIILEETYSYVRKVTRFYDNYDDNAKSYTYTYFEKVNKIYQDLDSLHKDFYSSVRSLDEDEALWFKTSEPNKLYKLRPQEITETKQSEVNGIAGRNTNYFTQALNWHNALTNGNNPMTHREVFAIGAGGGGGSGNAGGAGATGGSAGGLMRFLPDEAQPVLNPSQEPPLPITTGVRELENVTTNINTEIIVRTDPDEVRRLSLNSIMDSMARNISRNVLES